MIIWSVGQLVSWSVGQLVSWSVGQLISWSVGQLISWSVGQLISWSVGLSVSRFGGLWCFFVADVARDLNEEDLEGKHQEDEIGGISDLVSWSVSQVIS